MRWWGGKECGGVGKLGTEYGNWGTIGDFFTNLVRLLTDLIVGLQ